MLQPGGQNSIIIVGGANVSWTSTSEEGNATLFSSSTQEIIRGAGALLLQREVPDAVNIEAAKVVTYDITLHLKEINRRGNPEMPLSFHYFPKCYFPKCLWSTTEREERGYGLIT